ncbi:MAG: UvrD-helicase domain-containing protein [Austwickia sp.]|nr:MAG: UvrD-helicase domain-containing protein [Austwickia sp.]
MAWDADAVLAGLDPQQRDVASTPLGPMCVLAGAGTGKTRAITHRIAYGVHSGAYQPGRVLAVTFTARAAGEMRTRLRDLGVGGVQARTFHAAALRQLSYFWPRAIGGAPPRLQPQKAGLVARAGVRLGLQLDRAAVRDLAAEIEWAKVSGLTPDSYVAAARAARRDPAGLDLTAMARVLDAYEVAKTEQGVIDFEDVLLVMCGILADRDDIAAQVRDQYRHFVVDEYQDVNAVQQRLLELWLGGREEVCVVGDPSQTIYTFTGATPRHLLDFPRRHSSARIVRLVRNYRSTPQVVGLANLVLRQQRPGLMGGPEPLRLEAQAEPGPSPSLTAYDDEDAEAGGVAAAIAALIRAGTPASEIAVLFRTNGQSAGFEQALAAADIPYLVRGGERFFQREEVRQARDLLRGAAVSDAGEVPLPELARDVVAGMGWLPTPPAAGGAVREKWESVAAVVRLADDLVAASPQARLRDLVTELAERAAAQHAPTVQGVTLASLHAAKGLEWDVVFLVGCSDGYLPITMAEGPDAIDEERRLLYVGLTRARRELRLSWAGARQAGGRLTRRPSRFLDGAAAVLGDGARSTPKSGGGGERGRSGTRGPAKAVACRGCGVPLVTAAAKKIGRCADCPPTYDEATFERLRAWRLAVAQRDSVPAYVVFTDATLTAIAEAEPGDAAALNRISGVGARKLDRYGGAVLALVGGAAVDEVLAVVAGDSASPTDKSPGQK